MTNIQPTLKKGQLLSGWKLESLLGSGGNAFVWRACKGSDEVAIKVSKANGGEPLRRFRDEYTLMSCLNARKGTMRLIEGDIPDKVSQYNPAWFAMPVATALTTKLGEEYPLKMLVEAIFEYANTLSDLHRENIFHRDLKPENLFWKDDEGWIIGDFGLADYPDKESNDTTNLKKFGPLFYLAPEMYNMARDSSGGPADVYSLAKILWQMGAFQRYPMPGVLDRRIESLRLSTWVGKDALLLDSVLERATLHDPSDRITMAQMALELKAWLDKDGGKYAAINKRAYDCSEIREKLHILQEPTRRLREDHELFTKTMARIRSQYPLDTIRDVFTDLGSIDAPTNNLSNIMGVADFVGGRFQKIAGQQDAIGWYVALGQSAARSGLWIQLIDRNALRIVASHQLNGEIVWEEFVDIPAEGPLHEQELKNLIGRLEGHIDLLLDRIKEKLAIN